MRPVETGSKTNEAECNEQPPVESASERPVNRAPVDPPGHLGAMPWMQPDAYNMYQGNAATFTSMASNWTFQPMPLHGWGVPPFLAPLAGAVRHPFANFVAHHGPQYYGQPQPQPDHHQYEPMEEEHVSESFDADEAVAASNDDSDDMSDSESIDLPSTFAPADVVEKIRSRRLVEDLSSPKSPPKVRPTQNRVLTRSAAKALKKNATQAIVAHQAASPVSKDAAGVECDADSPEPEVMTVLGKKVTMIDPVRKVFIIDLLSAKECDNIRMMADDHTREVHESGSNVQVWREYIVTTSLISFVKLSLYSLVH